MRASIVVLALILTTPLLSGTAAAQGSGRNIRFAAMDTNNDGVISRREWRGSAQSFRIHDWNGDGVLSGDEVRVGGRRAGRGVDPDEFEDWDREYWYTDWTAEGFARLDHDHDGRITPGEWHFDRESFRRADHDGDGMLSRAEFLGGDDEDDRDDQFTYLDHNADGRVTRDEWHGTRARFDMLDSDRNGVLTRAEMLGTLDAPPDLFTSVDVDRDGAITWDEWHWSRAAFDQRDPNHDGRITREEMTRTGGGPTPQQSHAHRAGFERGLTDGRAAGRQDRERRAGWNLEGRRELVDADAGYDPRLNARVEYQAGYNDGFRRGYREGYTASTTRH